MGESGFLASAHRRVVDEFICAVVEEWAGDMGQVERNLLGVALRGEIETRLVPELLALHALLLGRTRRPWGVFRSGWTGFRLSCLRTRGFSLRWVGGWTQAVSRS